MTNNDWLNGMNTIEKAKWLCDVSEHCYYCGAKLNPVTDATVFVSPYRKHCPFGNDNCMNNPHEFEAWLKEEHEPDPLRELAPVEVTLPPVYEDKSNVEV